MSNDFLNLYQQEPLNVAQIDHYTRQVIEQLGLAYPRYSKIVLSEIDNVHHLQSVNFKADLVRGYRFEDEGKAGNIPDFLKKNLRSQKNHPISFVEYVRTQLFHHAIYNSFLDQFEFLGDKIERMYPLSPKYMYVKKDYKIWYQIIPNSDFQNYDEAGSIENNTDFTKNMKSFLNLGDSNTEKQQISEFSGLSSKSDYYPDIPYIDEIDDSILVNRLIGKYEREWIENNSNFAGIMALIGVDPTNTADKKLIDEWERKIKGAGKRAGEMIIIPVSSSDGDIKITTKPKIEKENFDATKVWNRDKIFTGHGVNPTILGIQTNESSLTATSIKESLAAYIETRGSNLVSSVSNRYDTIFKRIDPRYDTKLILETYQLKDAEKDAKTEALQISNEAALISAGNIDDFNSLRKKTGKFEYTPVQFSSAVRALALNTGFDNNGN